MATGSGMNRLEMDIHLILQRMKTLETNALPHLGQRLAKVEVNQRWLMGICLAILTAVVATVIGVLTRPPV